MKYNIEDIFKTVLCELQRTPIFPQVEHSTLYVMLNDTLSKVTKCHNTAVLKINHRCTEVATWSMKKSLQNQLLWFS